MKRNQSWQQNSISSYYFAVCPVDITFQKEYASKFTLYYQKSLQIITKFQAPHPAPPKHPLLFPPPPALQHFRIQSDKNLDYQWSLYMQQDEAEESEEFIEGQKITLKAAWTNFQDKRESVFESVQEFNAIKCKLTFIVLIGRTSAELPALAQQFLLKKSSNYSQPKEAAKPARRSIEEEEKPEKEERAEPGESREGASRSLQEVSNIKLDALQKVETDAQGSLIRPQDLKESKILTESPLKLPTETYESPPRQLRSPEQVAKLSLSEIELGQHIEKEVKTYEEATKKLDMTPQEVIVEAEPINEATAPVQAEKESNEANEIKENKEIALTQSQLLNDKKEAIVPFYKRKNIIILFVILLLLLAGTAFLSQRLGQEGKPLPEAKKEKKGKAKGVKEQVKQAKQVKQEKAKGKAGKGKGKK